MLNQVQVKPTDFHTLIFTRLSKRQPNAELGAELAYRDEISKMEAVIRFEKHLGNETVSNRVVLIHFNAPKESMQAVGAW
jgi:hypothetical protein